MDRCARDGSNQDVRQESVTDNPRNRIVVIPLCPICRAKLHNGDPDFHEWFVTYIGESP
jgi:hypothetical protein